MAKVRVKHLYIPRGTTYVFEVTYVTLKNVPIPITGYTANLIIRPAFDSAEILYEASTANGRLTFVEDKGLIRLTIPVDENTFTWSEGVYDLEVTAPSSQVFRLCKGSVYIDSEGS